MPSVKEEEPQVYVENADAFTGSGGFPLLRFKGYGFDLQCFRGFLHGSCKRLLLFPADSCPVVLNLNDNAGISPVNGHLYDQLTQLILESMDEGIFNNGLKNKIGNLKAEQIVRHRQEQGDPVV